MANKKGISEQDIYRLMSNNLKRFRSLHNISQLNLALSTGLTHNFINDIENCKKGISAKTLAKFSNVFKVEPHQFFLPETIRNNEASVYVKDFNDSLQKMVSDLTQQYLSGDKTKE